MSQRTSSPLLAARKWPSGFLPLTLGSAGLLAASLALSLLDSRQVLGVSTWVKPAKFAASVLVTAPAVALVIRALGPVTTAIRRAAAVIVATLTLELVLITLQAARAVPSHFNAATSLDSALFSVMGGAITMFWLAQLFLAWRAFRAAIAPAALRWGIRLGLVISLVGGAVGFFMPRPTPAQQESLRAGRPTLLVGGHAVGVEDGGPGLPVTGWSTEGGDLRAPHFLGLHALQLLPLAGWALSRRRRQPREEALLGSVVLVAGAGYGGLVAVALVGALRARPLFAPDPLTMGLAVAVLAATALGFAACFRRAARSPARRAEGRRPAFT